MDDGSGIQDLYVTLLACVASLPPYPLPLSTPATQAMTLLAFVSNLFIHVNISLSV